MADFDGAYLALINAYIYDIIKIIFRKLKTINYEQI